MPVALDEKIADLTIVDAHRRIESNPSFGPHVRRNPETGVHFEGTLPLDAHPELHGETFAVVVEHRETFLADPPHRRSVLRALVGFGQREANLTKTFAQPDGLRREQSIDFRRLHL